jgi:rhodanese-related sulfurtransferase
MLRLDPVDLGETRQQFAALDVRDTAAFGAGHLIGSGHLPLAELAERRAELPPRDAGLLVIAEDGPRARAAAEQVETLGYARVAWLDGSPVALPTGLCDRGPAVRLWRPSPFLEAVLPQLPDPRSGRCRVLDLAAGAGREAVFLAERGYRVDAWDHDRGALEKARALAERHGVTIDTEVRDLEIRDPRLPVGEHDVVMVFRFLHRPLFPRIAAAVAAGGCVVYETYLKGQERFGRPKHPRFLLDSGELPGHFPGFSIERYEEQTPAAGPLLARLLARRPAALPAIPKENP